MNNKNVNIQKYDFDAIEKEHLPYTIIPNQVIQNSSNIEAAFMWIYLQSLPKNWSIKKHHLLKHFKISERTYRRQMAWLSDSCLIENVAIKNEKGQIIKWNIIVLNGSRFNPGAGSDHNAKFGTLDENPEIQSDNNTNCMAVHNAKKPHSGFLASYIYKDNNLEKEIQKTTTTEPTQNPPPQPTQSSSSFSSKTITEEMLEQKLEPDSRSDEEFLSAVKHHIDNNSDKKYSLARRQFAIIKLLKKLKANGEIFVSAGHKITLAEPKESPKTRNILQIVREEYLEYRGRITSDINLGLLPRDSQILDERDWLQQNYPQLYVNNCQQMLQ